MTATAHSQTGTQIIGAASVFAPTSIQQHLFNLPFLLEANIAASLTDSPGEAFCMHRQETADAAACAAVSLQA